MSRKQNDRGNKSWFQERAAARAAGGTAPEGTAPEVRGQESTRGDEANPQEPPGQNAGNRGIGQYSGQGVPADTKK
jgi:hypothetical protein